MKKVLLLLLIVLPFLSHAQEKDIYDTAAQKMCEYLNNHADTKINSSHDAELLFSQGFLETCMPLVDRLLEKEKMQTFDKESGMLIGKKVGLKLAVMCPRYIQMIQPIINGELKKTNEAEAGNLKGIVIQVVLDGYTYLKLKTQDGSQKRLVWLTSFDEAETVNNNPQKLLNKQVELKWEIRQLYYFKSNSFASEKIITGLKLN